MIASIDSFDRYVKDFYPFAIARLQINVDPPLTKVYVVREPREREDWEDLRRLVANIGGPPGGLNWSKAKAVHWIMPASRDERLKLSFTKPKAVPSAILDYDAFIYLSASKMRADAEEVAARKHADELVPVEVYYALSSSCIQLAGMRAAGLAGIGTVVGHNRQAVGLMNEFMEKTPKRLFAERYAPNIS